MRENLASEGLLACTDQEGEVARGSYKGGSYWQDRFEALDGAEGDDLEGASGEGLGAHVLYIDVRQYKRAGDFAEEGRLFVVGFDQGEGDMGRPELDGEAGEAGTGTEIGQRARNG